MLSESWLLMQGWAIICGRTMPSSTTRLTRLADLLHPHLNTVTFKSSACQHAIPVKVIKRSPHHGQPTVRLTLNGAAQTVAHYERTESSLQEAYHGGALDMRSASMCLAQCVR